jgi:hypothetical protein
MDNLTYLIIIIGLTIFIIFFGGHNNQELIEYDTNYFNTLKSITLFENKINLIIKNNNIFSNENFININKFLNTGNILIPNFVNCFIIKINPYKIFNILNLINKSDFKTHIMIIYNHNLSNNLELMINENINENINDDYEIEKDSGFFYDLTKTISIIKINHIYNNSNDEIIITCFILKKPYWHN